MNVGNLDTAMTSRMSTRAFVARAIPRELIARLLQQAAHLSGVDKEAALNVHVVQGECRNSLCEKVCAAHDAIRAEPASLARYREQYDYYPEQWTSPYVERRRENGWGLYGLLGIGKADKGMMHLQHQRNYRFFDAPVGLMFTVDRARGSSSLMQSGMLLQNIMVVARSHGLHTCPQAAWNSFATIVLPHIGASSTDLLVCGMAIGYAEEGALVNTFHTPRLAASEFTHWLD